MVASVRLRTPSSSPDFSVESFNIFVDKNVERAVVLRLILMVDDV